MSYTISIIVYYGRQSIQTAKLPAQIRKSYPSSQTTSATNAIESELRGYEAWWIRPISTHPSIGRKTRWRVSHSSVFLCRKDIWRYHGEWEIQGDLQRVVWCNRQHQWPKTLITEKLHMLFGNGSSWAARRTAEGIKGSVFPQTRPNHSRKYTYRNEEVPTVKISIAYERIYWGVDCLLAEHSFIGPLVWEYGPGILQGNARSRGNKIIHIRCSQTASEGFGEKTVWKLPETGWVTVRTK